MTLSKDELFKLRAIEEKYSSAPIYNGFPEDDLHEYYHLVKDNNVKIEDTYLNALFKLVEAQVEYMNIIVRHYL